MGAFHKVFAGNPRKNNLTKSFRRHSLSVLQECRATEWGISGFYKHSGKCNFVKTTKR